MSQDNQNQSPPSFFTDPYLKRFNKIDFQNEYVDKMLGPIGGEISPSMYATAYKFLSAGVPPGAVVALFGSFPKRRF